MNIHWNGEWCWRDGLGEMCSILDMFILRYILDTQEEITNRHFDMSLDWIDKFSGLEIQSGGLDYRWHSIPRKWANERGRSGANQRSSLGRGRGSTNGWEELAHEGECGVWKWHRTRRWCSMLLVGQDEGQVLTVRFSTVPSHRWSYQEQCWEVPAWPEMGHRRRGGVE